jgi:hypothetical protein
MDPTIDKINYDRNGTVKSIYQYVDPTKKKDNGVFLIKDWKIVLALVYLIATIMILLAAVVLAYNLPKASGYNQNCAHGSCVKGLNLSCINSTCQCASNKYYSKGCKDKRIYLQTCNGETSHCQDNKNLICKDGLCKCSETFYWNGSRCLAKGTYKSKCAENTQCLTNTMLKCDNSTNKCFCDTFRLIYIFEIIDSFIQVDFSYSDFGMVVHAFLNFHTMKIVLQI